MNLGKRPERGEGLLFGVSAETGKRLWDGRRKLYLKVYLICCAVFLLAVLHCSHKAFWYVTDEPAQQQLYRLESGELITQELPAGKRTLKALHIRLGTSGRINQGELAVCLYKNDRLVREWRMDAQETADNEYQTFSLGRAVKLGEEDVCSFTVQHNYTGLTMEENGLSVWTSPGSSFTAARESGSPQTVEGLDVSFRLTLEDAAMRRSILIPFLIMLVLLLAAATVLIDLRRAGIKRILLGTFALILIAEVVSTDLMQRIVRDVPIHSFMKESDRASIRPGETFEEAFVSEKGSFDALEFSVSDNEERSDRMHVRLTGRAAVQKGEGLQDAARSEEEGEDGSDSRGGADQEAGAHVSPEEETVFFDGDVAGRMILSGGPAGKIIRIGAEDTQAGGLFPAGVYHLSITNLDEEKTIKLSILEEVLGEEAQSAGTEDSGQEGYEAASDAGSSDYEASDTEASLIETSREGGALDGIAEEAEPVVIQKLNYALLRRTDTGYLITYRVLLVLALYVLAVGAMLCRRRITTARFFMISAVPLGLIYMTLTLPWSAPDCRSHLLAANRFANLLAGKDESSAWTMSAQEAAYLPASWRGEKREPYYLPDMQDYVYGYEFDREAETLLLEEAARDAAAEAEAAVSSEEDPAAYAARTAGQLLPDGSVQLYPDEKMKFYSPLNYLPQILGLSAGRALGLGPSGILSLARLLMLAVYIAACLHAVKTAPAGKAAFALIGLFPTSLMMAASFSYDAMVLVGTLSFTAAVLRACAEPSRVLPVIESALWAALVGSVKGGGYLVLLPLALLPAFHAAKRNSGEEGSPAQEAWKGGAPGALLRVIPILGAGIAAILIFNVLRPQEALFQFGTTGTGKLAFSYALAHPVKYFDMMAAAYLEYADQLVFRMGGMMLTFGAERTVPYVVGAALTLVTGAYMLFEKDRLRFFGKDRSVMLAVILFEMVSTPMMLLSWTDVGSTTVEGLQGRYYLPILPLILLVASKFRLYNSERPAREVRSIGKSCIRLFCFLSCLGVYYMLRFCLTR